MSGGVCISWQRRQAAQIRSTVATSYYLSLLNIVDIASGRMLKNSGDCSRKCQDLCVIITILLLLLLHLYIIEITTLFKKVIIQKG